MLTAGPEASCPTRRLPCSLPLQLGGAIAGVICAYSQFTQQLNRVPIPRKDKDGRWMYMQVGVDSPQLHVHR